MKPLALATPFGLVRPLAWADEEGRVHPLASPGKHPLYVRRQVLNAVEIIAWAKALGFETTLPAEDMHVTCCFSKEPVDWKRMSEGKPPLRFVVAPGAGRSVQALGDKGAVVLRFPSEELEARWRQFRERGASWDYDEYHPHITVSYNVPESVDAIPPYSGPIELGHEIFEVIVEDWEKGVKEHAQRTTSAIKQTLDALEQRSLADARDALEEVRDALVSRVRNAGDLVKLVNGLDRLPRFSAVEAELRLMLDRAWEAGGKDARREVRDSVKSFAGTASSFTPRAAVRWLRAHAFWISGILGDQLLGESKRVILSGLKSGKATMVIAEELLVAFLPWLGDPDVIADEKQLEPYRLETIVRTNLTTAYNHGRLTEFMSADTVRFLKGVRYSAVLDERTTEVCRFLDQKVFKPGNSDLEALLPSNHYNCRAIVVPVVAGEKVDESEFITPAEIGRARALADAKFLSEHADVWRAYREIA